MKWRSAFQFGSRSCVVLVVSCVSEPAKFVIASNLAEFGDVIDAAEQAEAIAIPE